VSSADELKVYYSDDRSPHISDVSDVIGVDASSDPSREGGEEGRASEEPTTTDGFDSNSKIGELRIVQKGN
jgi:hypothetical protein